MHLRLEFDRDRCLGSPIADLERRTYLARRRVPAGFEELFVEQARYLKAQASTAIEGIEFGEEENRRILAERDAAGPDQRELLNLADIYERLGQLTSDPAFEIDAGIIRTINSELLRGVERPGAEHRGRWRVRRGAIQDKSTLAITYVPPAPEHVDELMRGFIQSVQGWTRDLPAAVAAALAHFGLVSIHPFEDGNGRTARVLADLILDMRGASADGMLTVSQAIREDAGTYFRTLREVQGPEFQESLDVTPFVEFHTRALVRAAGELEARVEAVGSRVDQFARGVQEGGATLQRAMRALVFVDLIRPISSSDYARINGVSQATATADLSRLRVLFERVGKGRNTRYRLTPELKQIMAGGKASPS